MVRSFAAGVIGMRAWLVLFGISICACAPSQTRPDASEPPFLSDGGTFADGGVGAEPSRRALFIGNSYTYQNDLPALVRALGVATPGGALVTEMAAQGGATLGTHWLTPGTQERIADGGFDFVVLQGQSLEAVHDPDAFDHYARLLADAVDAAGAQGVWFATWARRDGHPDYATIGDPAWMTYAIEERYRLAAALHDDVVALVGAAFRLARAELASIVLYDGDGSHPSTAGSLLAACTIFRAMTGLAPRLPTPAPLGISNDDARALCTLAARVGPSPRACPRLQTLCGEKCVYLDWDAENCGACGRVCPGEDPCRSAVCGCAAPYAGCARSCWDLSSSTTHCGACGVECLTGEVCAGATCRCAKAAAVEMSGEALAALRPGCTGSTQRGASLDCREAAHELCAAYGACFRSGLPPPTGHSPTFFDGGLCVAGDVRVTTYAVLRTFEASCDGVVDRSGRGCVTAASRYCASQGAVSGWGPIQQTGDDVTVVCLPDAVRVRTTEAALGTFASRCVPDAIDCQSASRAFCESSGYVGGFGPVETQGTDVDVVCLRP
jgi:hypothetical protein